MNFNIFFLGGGGGVQKDESFLGCEDFVDTFVVFTKLDYFWGSFLCILGSFLKVKVQIRNIFGGLLNYKIFVWVCLIFQIFLEVNSRSWIQAYVAMTIECTPPPGGVL